MLGMLLAMNENQRMKTRRLWPAQTLWKIKLNIMRNREAITTLLGGVLPKLVLSNHSIPKREISCVE